MQLQQIQIFFHQIESGNANQRKQGIMVFIAMRTEIKPEADFVAFPSRQSSTKSGN